MFKRSGAVIAPLIVACLAAANAAALASAAEAVTIPAQARTSLGTLAGIDAGITAGPRTTLRVTAGGAIALARSPECGPAIGPRGCPGDRAPGARPLPFAPSGALLGTFVDAAGRPLTASFMIGEAAIVVSPPVHSRLIFTVNAPAAAPASGAFHAVAAPAEPAAGPPGAPRAMAQHMLRRLAFAASPEYVNAVLASGPANWLRVQLNPRSIDDSVAEAALEARPVQLDAQGNLPDPTVYSRRLVQRQFGSARQLQEKLVLHWIDHFAVGNGKVANEALMGHYEETLRADALGNFKTLLADVSKEPAMLYWLDNDNNDGSNPQQHPPNENFARELLQLYVMGTTQLNADGSPRGAAGRPLPAYSQGDVQALAQALSGFAVGYNCGPGSNPNACFGVDFFPEMHTPGPKTILGTAITDPNSAAVIDVALDVLVRNPSTAPFQAKELLQRLVTENPSPQYVAAVAAKWAQTVDAPDQIAQVVRAVVENPEFAASYRSLLKEPVELELQTLRQLPGVIKAGSTGSGSAGPAFDLVDGANYLSQLQQSPFYPPSVFSFYRPGNKAKLLTQQSVLARFNVADALLAAAPADPQTTVAVDTNALRARAGSGDRGRMIDYLLDALLDGGTPALRASLEMYLSNGTDDTHVRGAIWLLLTAPEYEVN